MKVWDLTPPSPPPVTILRIVELDFDVIPDNVRATPRVQTLSVTPSHWELLPNNHGSVVSLCQQMKYIVYFSDGTIARSNMTNLRSCLRIIGQHWGGD